MQAEKRSLARASACRPFCVCEFEQSRLFAEFRVFGCRSGHRPHDSGENVSPEPKLAKGAQNVVIVVLYESDSAYSGYDCSTIETSNINLLASAALSSRVFSHYRAYSPSRARPLTGRNHQAIEDACYLQHGRRLPN